MNAAKVDEKVQRMVDVLNSGVPCNFGELVAALADLLGVVGVSLKNSAGTDSAAELWLNVALHADEVLRAEGVRAPLVIAYGDGVS